MEAKSLMLVGNPDSGKSNFVAALWLALKSKKFHLQANGIPSNIEYVEELVEHVLGGEFAPRTDKAEERVMEFNISITSNDTKINADICVPDVSGEMWEKAVKDLEISEKWMTQLESSSGAILFVRVLSPLNVQPMDWVTCSQVLGHGAENAEHTSPIPTQVSLIELLRFLEENLYTDGVEKPKVAVLVSAWDLLNHEDANKGPKAYLHEQFPLFAGRLDDKMDLDIKVFGLSSFGCNLDSEELSKQYKEGNMDHKGYVVTDNVDDSLEIINDITAPIEWLLRSV